MTTVAASLPGAWGRLSASAGRAPVWLLVAALVLVGVLVVPDFATPGNGGDLVRQGAALGIVAIGQTIVMIAGGIDLSVGSLMTLVVVVSSILMNGDPAMIPLAVVVSLLIGLLAGAFNGVMIATTRIYPLLQTFGMLSILKGIVFLFTEETAGSSPQSFQQLAYGSVGPVPIPGIVLVVLFVSGWYVLRRTVFGRYVYAVGGSDENARRAGVPNRSVTVAAYILCGLLAAVAGLVLSARLGVGSTLSGSGYDIDSIVAVVIGGTALTGGRGTMLGTLAGVAVMILIANMLNLLGVPAYVQQIIKGGIVVAAVALYGVAELRRQAR